MFIHLCMAFVLPLCQHNNETSSDASLDPAGRICESADFLLGVK